MRSNGRSRPSSETEIPSTGDADAVEGVRDYYDRWTDLFVRGFGPVLQAGILPTGDPPREDPEASVLALAERAGIRDGDRILDAGCGVAGPAVVIAHRYPQVTIDGVTLSPEQASIAEGLIGTAGLEERVRVHVADYQRIPFGDSLFDLVLFFESTGYATDLAAAYREAFRVARPGGAVYVKDVFRRAGRLDRREEDALDAFDRLWGCVRTKSMEESVEALEAAGFDVERSSTIPEAGTARLLGSMFDIDPQRGLVSSDLGRVFGSPALGGPVHFGEIRAVRPT